MTDPATGPTSIVHLIRHAHAGSRSKWDRADTKRPLSERGLGQSQAIASALADAGIDLLWSSPSLRCRQTLEFLADKIGVPIEVREEFDEGGYGGPALDAVLTAATAGRTLAVCSHGDVLPDLISTAIRRGADLLGSRPLAKGARCECTVVDGVMTTIVMIGPPDGDT